VTPEEESLARIVGILESAGIAYMVAGSFASSHHGRPRITHDADVVIDPSPATLERLVGALTAAGFYVDATRAQDALRARRQFNAIDNASAFKIDLIIRKNRAFSEEEFRRRTDVELLPGVSAAIATAEDTVVSKLEWARKAGESEKQLADAAGIVEVSKSLDRDYIQRWSKELGVLDLWERIARGR
jgi:acetolactate synthase regulatory subunit